MKYKTMQEIETRKAQILEEMEKEGADLDGLKKEMEELRQNADELREAAKQAEETRKAIAEGAKGVTVIETRKAETTSKTVDEIRGSAEYAEAFKSYILTGDDKECRALLTTNATSGGQVPVPVLVDQIIRTAWENDTILSRVRKTSFKGNLKVAFERAADPAYEHGEGTTAVTEEDLTLGIVEMVPKNIKKWIRISDESVALGGEAFVRYVYEELTYQIIKKLSALVIGDIAGAGTSHTSSAIGVPKIEGAPSLTIVPEAEANLSDEARDVVVIINRLSSAAFNEARVAGNFAVDPYDGLTVLYSSALPAYSTASDNAVWMIVGDLGGEQVNYPEGEGVIIKWDDLTEAEADMVKVVGRQFAAHKITGPGRFVNVKKAAAVVTT
ncbi:MAG: phage major capsid protein [Lachnospiraceae bacterium]|nr:phage major capsid protein [Lachnospiraceae bacterium]